MRAVLPKPRLSLLHIIINAVADIPEGFAVIGFDHMGAFMGGDIVEDKGRGRN